MLAIELGARGGSVAEARGILDVVETRMRRTGLDAVSVITSSNGAPLWGCVGDCAYNRTIRSPDAPVNLYAVQAAMARPVASGAVGFVHPRNRGFRSPSERRTVLLPSYGAYVPAWAASRAEGGTATRVIEVGVYPTRFAWD